MRSVLLLPLCLAACQTAAQEGELSRAECADLARRVQRLESDETGGLKAALQAAHGGNVEGCLKRGTRRAHRCVMQAQSRADLRDCDLLFR